MTYAAFVPGVPALRSAVSATTATSLHALPPTTTSISSLLLSSAATTSEIYAGAHSITGAKEFEPMLPDPGALLGMVAIIVMSAVAYYVWDTQVVPTSRTKLALQKRKGGQVDQYLEELLDEQASRDRKLEQWLFTDWLETKSSARQKKAGRQKEPALPILKNAKWNSGDNPVLAATALIILGVTFASVTEQISALL